MRIIVFGDSITQGFHDTEDSGWTNRLSTFVMKKEVESEFEYNKSIVNLGVSGDNTEDLLRRVEAETDARILKYPTSDYDVVLLAIGINDSQFNMESGENRVSPEQFEKNILEIVSLLETRVKKIIVLGITPVVDELIQPMPWKLTHGYSNEMINSYNETLEKITSDTEDMLYISMSDVYEDSSKFLPDGLHPNAEGHRLIFERVKEALEREHIL